MRGELNSLYCVFFQFLCGRNGAKKAAAARKFHALNSIKHEEGIYFIVFNLILDLTKEGVEFMLLDARALSGVQFGSPGADSGVRSSGLSGIWDQGHN